MKILPKLSIITVLLLLKTSSVLSQNGNVEITNSKDISELGKLLAFLKLLADQHVNPTKTFWFFTETTPKSRSLRKDPLEESLSTIWTDLHSQHVPLFTGKSMGKEIRNLHVNFNSFIFLTLTNSEGPPLKTLIDSLFAVGNRRKDRFVFISQRDQTLEEIFPNAVVLGLKFKFGFNLKDNTMLIEGHIFLQGAMDRVTDLSQIEEKPQIGRNLRGRHLRFCGSLLPPWLYVKSPPNAKVLEYDGSHFRIYFESAKKFNFSYTLHAPEGYGYGNLLPNGTWIGEVGDIIYNERNYDLAMVIGHFESYYPFIEMLDGLGYANLIFVTGNPQFEITWDTFLFPYMPSVWIGVTCVYVAMSLTMLVFLRFMKYTKMHKESQGYTFLDEVYYAFGAPYAIALEQDFAVLPGFRFLCILWMISMIITGTGYKCNLASYLSLPMAQEVPTNYEELALNTDYEVFLNNLGSTEENFFATNESPAMKEVGRRLSYVPNPIECIQRAFLGPKVACIAWTPLVFAFIGQSLTLNPRIEPLTAGNEAAVPVASSGGLQKDSIYVDSFRPIANSYYETGTFSKWEQDVFYHFKVLGRAQLLKKGAKSAVYRKLKEQESAAGGDFTPFTLKNVQMPFYILAVGLIFGLVRFVFETDVWKMRWIRKIFAGFWKRLLGYRRPNRIYVKRNNFSEPKPVKITVRELERN